MSRFHKDENENPNPAERFFQWNGDREYGGKVQYYDKTAGENVDVELPFTFWILDKVAQITGGLKVDGKFQGYWSNAVKDTREQPFTVRSKAGIVAQGLYEDLKVREGFKFQLGLYIGFRDENDELRLGFIKFKGSSLGAWFEFTKEHRDIYQGGFTITGGVKMKNGATVYYSPTFEHEPEQPAELLDELMAIYKPLKSYLDAYFKAGPALPESNKDGDELTHTGPPQDESDADFYRDNTSGPKAAATAHRIIPVLTPELKVLCNELNKFLHPSEAWTAEIMDAHAQSEFDKPLANLNEEEMDVLLTDMGEILKEQRAIAESNEPSEPEPEKPKAKAAVATASVERAKASKISTIRRMVDIKGWDKSEAEFLKAAKVEGKLKSFDELSTKQADDLIAAMQA